MDLIEYDGKKLYKQYNVPTTNFVFFDKPVGKEAFYKAINKLNDKVVVKIQIFSGKRGKRGGVQVVEKKDVYKVFTEMWNIKLGVQIKGVLVENAIEYEKEIYLSLVVDREKRDITVLFSRKGGIYIEENSDSIKEFSLQDIDNNLNAESGLGDELKNIIHKLYDLMLGEDAILVEINPLVVTKDGKLVALDSKIILDNNALFRHKDRVVIQKTVLDQAELQAKKEGIAFVRLDGDIGVIGNGAGLTMATVDYINLATDYKPANFLDIGGGASSEKVLKSLELVYMLQPKVIWLNIFGGITSCLDVAQGIVHFVKNTGFNKIVARMVGRDYQEAVELLQKHGVKTVSSMQKSISVINNMDM